MPFMLELYTRRCRVCRQPLTYQGIPYGRWPCACYPDGLSDLNLMVGLWTVPAEWQKTSVQEED